MDTILHNIMSTIQLVETMGLHHGLLVVVVVVVVVVLVIILQENTTIQL